LFVLGVGFAAGYGVRDWKSRKRRRRYPYLGNLNPWVVETDDEEPDITLLHPERNKVGRDLAA
jgi:hypothetical protein